MGGLSCRKEKIIISVLSVGSVVKFLVYATRPDEFTKNMIFEVDLCGLQQIT